jgi:hypothetical protein
VLDRVAAVSISAGLDVFFDCLSLHSGETWKPQLLLKSNTRPVYAFLVCRSRALRVVTSEWRRRLPAKARGPCKFIRCNPASSRRMNSRIYTSVTYTCLSAKRLRRALSSVRFEKKAT